MKLTTKYKKILADTFTPVGIYLKLRDIYPNSLLLESSDNKGADNSYSFICINPIASFQLNNSSLEIEVSEKKETINIQNRNQLSEAFESFKNNFESDNLNLKFPSNGLFGYTSFDAIPYLEEIEFSNIQEEYPLLNYQVFRNIIVVNHFNNELYIIDHLSENESNIEEILTQIQNRTLPNFQFEQKGKETSNYDDKEFLDIINKGKEHCQRGDVFQIVLSRKFKQGFAGDEFNVYRALRSINPSPYLFYFDYGNFKVFGSSPEAQLTVQNNVASIYPIAGTFVRTGDDKNDAIQAGKLKADPKESAEHDMLVDLARNDLSKNSDKVEIVKYKEIEYYSHVIHLVSKVSSVLNNSKSAFDILADTFPAGTLSGAPKYKAMQLIDKYENQARGLYGGCIGFVGFDGSFNHAIVIRSFISKNNVLHYQAGAGVVSKSIPESELQEVNNKLMALKKSLTLAETI